MKIRILVFALLTISYNYSMMYFIENYGDKTPQLHEAFNNYNPENKQKILNLLNDRQVNGEKPFELKSALGRLITPLCAAIILNDKDIFDKIIKNPEFKIENHQGSCTINVRLDQARCRSIVQDALASGNNYFFSELIRLDHIKLFPNEHGVTPLLYALQQGKLEQAEKLLELCTKADENTTTWLEKIINDPDIQQKESYTAFKKLYDKKFNLETEETPTPEQQQGSWCTII
ncbi:MAG: hypothetical protein AB7R69_03030 [Candidatus Babeliales bacterium]